MLQLPAGMKVGQVVYYTGTEKLEETYRLSYGDTGVVKGMARAKSGETVINVSFGAIQAVVGLDASVLSTERPSTKLASGFQVGDVVFYLGKSMKWPSGDKVCVGSRGVAKGPGETGPNDISVVFEGNKMVISLNPGHIMPASPDWEPHSILAPIPQAGGA
jgi:hypothetical protein